MSLNLNRTMLAGNLTRDVQVRFLSNEKAVASFAIAINRRYKDSAGEQKEETTFVDIDAWGRTAELCGQYLKKGSPVFIEGSLKLDTWEDKDGKKMSKLKVRADSVQFLDRKPQGNEDPTRTDAPAATAAPSRPRSPAPAAADDEPPF